jgi:chromosome segregation ATPase
MVLLASPLLQLQSREASGIANLLSTVNAAHQERERACERISRLETRLVQSHVPPFPRTTHATLGNFIAPGSYDESRNGQLPCRSEVVSSSPALLNASNQAGNTFTFPSQSPLENGIGIQSTQATESLSALHQEAEMLHRSAELAAAEIQGQRARAEAAEERARLAEARASASVGAIEAAESEVRSLRQQVGRLTTELAAAEDRMTHLDAALGEERRKEKRRSTGAAATAGAAAEAALTAQVRALTAQLQATKTESVTLKQEVASLRSSAQGQAAEREMASAVVLSANRELEAALSQAANDLDARAEELQNAQEVISKLSDENKELRATSNEWQRRAERENAAATQSSERAAASERTIAELTAQLREAKTRVAQLEDSMRRQSVDDGRSGVSSASPLRDVVGTLRAELQHRELRIVSLEEELVAERRRASDLQKQFLDQAEELDDTTRRGRSSETSLRSELEAARAEIAELREQLKVEKASAGNQKNEDDPTAETSQLREALAEREAELTLQGLMLRGGDVFVENWLTMDA